MHTARHNETGPENRACFLKRQVRTFFLECPAGCIAAGNRTQN